MSEHVLEREQLVAASPATVFEFFAQARNLERITPPWLRFAVLDPGSIEMAVGTLIACRLWHHRHEFSAVDGGTVVRDRVRYALPLGAVGAVAHALFVRRDLEKIFDFRREAVRRELG